MNRVSTIKIHTGVIIMKDKICIAIPKPLNISLRKRAIKAGMSLSAFISFLLMKEIESGK